MNEYVVTFSRRPVVGVGALSGLRRMPFREAEELVSLASRIPKSGRIIHVGTLEEVTTRRA